MTSLSNARFAMFAITVISGGGAFAADLAGRAIAPAYVSRPPAFTWTGFYVGANAGYATRTGKDYTFAVQPGYFSSSPATVGTIQSERTGDGFLAGAQVGYNYQVGNFVIGAENDLQYLDLGKKKSTYSFAGSGAIPLGFNYNGPDKKTEYFATGRARIGYAFDNLLVFGSAGLAYGQLKSENCLGSKCDNGKIGFAVGAGVEYALSQKWSVKVEGLYVNLGKTATGVIGTDVVGRTYVDAHKIDNDIALVRAGLNYRF